MKRYTFVNTNTTPAQRRSLKAGRKGSNSGAAYIHPTADRDSIGYPPELNTTGKIQLGQSADPIGKRADTNAVSEDERAVVDCSMLRPCFKGRAAGHVQKPCA